MSDKKHDGQKEEKIVESASVQEVANDEMVEKLKSEVHDYKNKYLRALADYQNFQKRVEEERIELRKLAQISVLQRILPIMDNLDKAEVFIKDEGLRLVKDHFMQILQELGLKEVDVLHKEYDPHTAEAIEMVPGEKDNQVVEILRKGYELNGKVLRPAQVKVSKKMTGTKS